MMAMGKSLSKNDVALLFVGIAMYLKNLVCLITNLEVEKPNVICTFCFSFLLCFAFPLIVLLDLVSIICFDQQYMRGGKERMGVEGAEWLAGW